MSSVNVEVDVAPADAKCTFCGEVVGAAGGWRIKIPGATIIGCKRCKEKPSQVFAELERIEEARGKI